MDLGPCALALYPEYLTDPNVVFCPSDANGDEIREQGAKENGEWCFGQVRHDGAATVNWRDECASAIDTSYGYIGFAFDSVDTPSQPFTSSDPLLGLIAQLGYTGVTVPPGAECPSQAYGAMLGLISGCVQALLGGVPYEVNRTADNDITMPNQAPYNTLGNSGGNKVYRLKEGVERFMITDINNPAATAMAQSELFVMWDNISAEGSAFNHVPGGSNVLYMDGHVEFVKYPGKPPVSMNMAAILGVFYGSN
jgi:prepilin-type processing-associated H-X9-DG protein